MEKAVKIVLSSLLAAIAALFPAVIQAEDDWKTFNPDCQKALPSFCYSPELIELDESFEGESKWIYYMATPDGDFSLTSNGFYCVPESVLEENETPYGYVWRLLQQRYKGSISFSQKTEHVLTVVSIKENVKTFHKVFISRKDSSGSGINELIIRFPHSKHLQYDEWMLRIERSWKPAFNCYND